jgi:S1-C subfamily serine protease
MISNHFPEITEKIFNISAPLGVFIPKAPFVFMGTYSGYYTYRNMIIVSVPIARGSSGSMILNSECELIGIVLELIKPGFEAAGYGATFENVQKLLEKAKSIRKEHN